MMDQQRQLLTPFHSSAVKVVDKGAYKADYVSWTDKIQRLYQLGIPFSWEILQTGNSGDTHEPVAVGGRLRMTIDGVERSFDGMGQGRDAKTASTDAFSRACAFAGLGLHLWCQGGTRDGGYWVTQALDKADE